MSVKVVGPGEVDRERLKVTVARLLGQIPPGLSHSDEIYEANAHLIVFGTLVRVAGGDRALAERAVRQMIDDVWGPAANVVEGDADLDREWAGLERLLRAPAPSRGR